MQSKAVDGFHSEEQQLLLQVQQQQQQQQQQQHHHHHHHTPQPQQTVQQQSQPQQVLIPASQQGQTSSLHTLAKHSEVSPAPQHIPNIEQDACLMLNFLSFYLTSIQWVKKAVLMRSVLVFKSYSLEDFEKAEFFS